MNAIVAAYAEWLATSDVPKLFIKAEPGALLGGGPNLDTVRKWPAQTEVTVAGVHFIPGRFAGRDRSGYRRLDEDIKLMRPDQNADVLWPEYRSARGYFASQQRND